MTLIAGELETSWELSVNVCAIFVFKSSILKFFLILKSSLNTLHHQYFTLKEWSYLNLLYFGIYFLSIEIYFQTGLILLSKFRIWSNTTCTSALDKFIFHGDIPSETDISWHYLHFVCSEISDLTVIIAYYLPLARTRNLHFIVADQTWKINTY